MCRIIVGKNYVKNFTNEDLLYLYRHLQTGNTDGTGIVFKRQDKTLAVKSEYPLHPSKVLEYIEFEKEITGIHFRNASSGEVNSYYTQPIELGRNPTIWEDSVEEENVKYSEGVDYLIHNGHLYSKYRTIYRLLAVALGLPVIPEENDTRTVAELVKHFGAKHAFQVLLDAELGVIFHFGSKESPLIYKSESRDLLLVHWSKDSYMFISELPMFLVYKLIKDNTTVVEVPVGVFEFEDVFKLLEDKNNIWEPRHFRNYMRRNAEHFMLKEIEMMFEDLDTGE